MRGGFGQDRSAKRPAVWAMLWRTWTVRFRVRAGAAARVAGPVLLTAKSSGKRMHLQVVLWRSPVGAAGSKHLAARESREMDIVGSAVAFAWFFYMVFQFVVSRTWL